MKTRPPAVMIGPPRFGVPRMAGARLGTRSAVVPSGTFQRIVPLDKLTATNAPQGGGLHGSPLGERSTCRLPAHAVRCAMLRRDLGAKLALFRSLLCGLI